MKIGFFTDDYLPVTHGVQISVSTFKKVLERMGHQVFIYAPYTPGYKDKTSNVFRFHSIKVIKKPEMRLAVPFLPKQKRGNILNFKLDVVHAHTPFTMGLLAKVIAKHQKIPLVYTHHTHYPEYAKIYLKEKVITPLLARFLSTRYANLADTIIAPSYKIKKLLREYGVKKKKPIHILSTGIDLKLFKKSKKNRLSLRKKLKISPKAKVLIFVGRMGKEKNVTFLLKSIKEVSKKEKDVILLMVGDGPFLANLQKMAEKMKLEDNILFTKNIPHLKIPAYYQAADIFVFSSLTETQGIVILEAIACGLPVVALEDSAFKGIAVNNKNSFLIKKALPTLFAKKVIELINNPSLCQQFSKASQKIVDNFSEEKQAERLITIYKELIKN